MIASQIYSNDNHRIKMVILFSTLHISDVYKKPIVRESANKLN